MGRRKFYDIQDSCKNDEKKDKVWNTASYSRLSFTKNKNNESDSISSQRMMIDDLIKDNPNLVKVAEYSDDGHTGLNTDRPAFKKMMENIKNGNVNCIVVKNLSRLGRYAVEIRTILEQLLPKYECRIISIGENLDSYLRPNDVFNIYIHFTQLVNEYSSIETSINTRMALDMQRAEGKVVFPFAPYGYKKSETDKHKFVIDEEPAEIIKLIYKLSLSGMGVVRITQHLNKIGIDPPSAYKKKKNIIRDNKIVSKNWNDDSVRCILSNISYAGHLQQKIRSKPNYLSNKMETVPKENRFIVHNTHEAIISQRDFDTVQNNFKRCTYTRPNQTQVHLFSGFLRCMDCNGSMAKCSKYGKYVTYKCRTYQRKSKDVCSHSHVIKHEELENVVFHAIKAQIYAIANLTNVFQKVNSNNSTKEKIKHLDKRVRQIENEIRAYETTKFDIYKDWKSDTISKSDYLNFINIEDKNISKSQSKLNHLQKELSETKNIKEKNIKWFTEYMNHYDKCNLDREMLTALIDFIYIGKEKNIKIVFKYQDKIDSLAQFIADNTEVKPNVK